MKSHRFSIAFYLILASFTTALAAQENPQRFTLQWAVLQSAQDFTGAGGGDLQMSGLVEWDFRSGTLYDHFPNQVIGSMQRGDKDFYGNRSTVSLRASGSSEPIDIDVSVLVESLERQWRSREATKTSFVIRRGGKVVSTPTVRTELGQKAITATPSGDGGPPVYVLIQVDPLS